MSSLAPDLFSGMSRLPLNAAQKQTAISVLQVGCSLRAAARAVGRSVRGLRRECRDDPAFHSELLNALSHAEMRHMKNLYDAAAETRNWRASAWALERMYPDQYGVKRPGTITRAEFVEMLTQLSDVVVAELPAVEDRQRVLRALRRLTSSRREKAAATFDVLPNRPDSE